VATSAASVKAAGRAVQGDEFEGHLLGHGHHDLLELGLRAEADEPDLGAGVVFREVSGLIKGVAGPGVENGGQHHLVFQGRASGAGHGLQGLERIRDNSATDDNLICGAHVWQMIKNSGALGSLKRGEVKRRV